MGKRLSLLSLLSLLLFPTSTVFAAPEHGFFVVTASFTPSTIYSGESTTLKWRVYNEEPYNVGCTISGIPGITSSDGWNGSFTLQPTESLNATVICEDAYNVGTATATLTLSGGTAPQPTINISYPSSVYAYRSYPFEVTTQNATSCVLTYYEGATLINMGTYFSTPLKYTGVRTLVQTVSCDGPGGPAVKQHTVTVLPAEPPTITISYPGLVYEDTPHDLEVRTTNATSCTLKLSDNANPQDVGTSHDIKNLEYTTPGEYTQTVFCEGNGGTTTVETHAVTVLSTLPTAPPEITRFQTGSVMNQGNIDLIWNSRNTDRCVMESNGVTHGVPTSHFFYPVTIPLNTRKTFTLTCYQGSISVFKKLSITRGNS